MLRLALATTKHVRCVARLTAVRNVASTRLPTPVARRSIGVPKRRGYASKSSARPDSPVQALPSHRVLDLPALSPTMETGNVGAWQKQPGDKIEVGDVLVEIETDKAQMGFEAQDDGYLAAILIPNGTKDVPVGKVRLLVWFTNLLANCCYCRRFEGCCCICKLRGGRRQ